MSFNSSKKTPHKVAFQGTAGAYSEKAARKFFEKNKSLTFAPCKSFAEVFEQIKNKRVRWGVVPLENSLAGSIHQNYDLMLQHKIHIVGEIHLRVQHCLLVHKNTKLSQVRKVYSHPQALAQCAKFLRSLKKAEAVPFFDTAGSAEHIALTRQNDAAAIASKEAAKIHGLKVLKEGIEDDKRLNFTRFAVLQKTPLLPGPKTPAKISLLFSLKDVPASLHKALAAFAMHDINLSKIESRPEPGKLWRYLFYVDFLGHLKDPNVKRAMHHLDEVTDFVRILGCYPKADVETLT